MSDNIIRPEQWLSNGAASLESKGERVEASDRLGGGGDGPHDPDMDQRVATLEADMKDVKGSLSRIETTLGRIEERMVHFATKADLASNTGALNTLSANVTALDGRVGKVEKAIDDTVKTALGKSIGPWQFPLILAGSAAVLIAAAGAMNWLMVHGFFPHSP